MSGSEGTQINTPVGRVVWGNPAKMQIKKDQQTNQPVIRDGKQVEQWAFGLAIPKDQFGPVWAAMAAEAAKGYPSGVPSNFSWKYKDGDGVDSKGQPYSSREGWAGCYVLTIATELMAPPIYKLHNGQYVQITPEQIKTGDYVVVALNIKVNVPQQRTHTPGLYINPVAIEHVGYGAEIQNGPDAATLFGGAQHQLPPGASTTPVQAQNAPGMPGTMPQGQPPMQPGQMPGTAPAGMPGQMPGQPMQQQPMTQPGMPMQQPAMQPGQMPPPAYGFTQPGVQQPVQQQQPMQPGYQQPGMPMQQQPGMQPQGMPGQMPGQMPPRT